MLAGAALSIYAGYLYHELYLKGCHNRSGRKVSLKSLRLIIAKDLSAEDRAIAIKCLKLYYGYLVVFYTSLILMICYVVYGIDK